MKLRNYQVDIADRAEKILRSAGIVYLAMQTRTGKTATALTIANKMDKKNVCFITKKKAMPSIDADHKLLGYGFNVDIVSVDSAHKIKGDYDLFIVDEAHSIGAYPKPSKRAKDLKNVIKNNDLILLSATPTPESYSQIYHQFWISENTPFVEKTFYKWAVEFVNKKQKMINGFSINDYSNAKIDKIEQYVKNLMISFTQEQAGFEQELFEKILFCEANDVQAKTLKILLRDRIVNISNGNFILADTPAKLMTKTHQISSGTVIDENKNSYVISTSKAKAIKENAGDYPIAIFYKYVAERDAILAVFSEATESPEDFQSGKSDVFIGQFQSAREGIRLDRAKDIYFYNIDFSFLSYEQAKNRIMSKERKNRPTLWWCFTDHKLAIETKIYEVVKKKKNFTNYYFKTRYDL